MKQKTLMISNLIKKTEKFCSQIKYEGKETFFFKNIESSENRFSLWNICKLYVSSKGASSEKIILVEVEKIITGDKKTC